MAPTPSTVTVKEGETDETVDITTLPVVNTTAANIAATYAGVSKSRVVTI